MHAHFENSLDRNAKPAERKIETRGLDVLRYNEHAWVISDNPPKIFYTFFFCIAPGIVDQGMLVEIYLGCPKERWTVSILTTFFFLAEAWLSRETNIETKKEEWGEEEKKKDK